MIYSIMFFFFLQKEPEYCSQFLNALYQQYLFQIFLYSKNQLAQKMKMREKILIFNSFIYDITSKHKLFHFFLCALVLLDFSVSKTLIMIPILYFMYLLGSNWDFHQKYGGHLGKWRLEKKLGKFRPSIQNFLMPLDVQKHKNKVS